VKDGQVHISVVKLMTEYVFKRKFIFMFKDLYSRFYIEFQFFSQQMVYTTEVLKLVCGLKQNPRLESPCYMHVISALHVTLADLLREKVIKSSLLLLLCHIYRNMWMQYPSIGMFL
jgi:hypothetical protein